MTSDVTRTADALARIDATMAADIEALCKRWLAEPPEVGTRELVGEYPESKLYGTYQEADNGDPWVQMDLVLTPAPEYIEVGLTLPEDADATP